MDIANVNLPSRDDMIHKVLMLGVQMPSESPYKVGSKERIQDYYKRNHPTLSNFAEFIEKEYGWHGAGAYAGRDSFIPHDFFYNHAGLQYRYRDENKNIKLECLEWNDVARRIAKLIDNGNYCSPPVKKRTENTR